jgi:hypothetical protein
MAGRLSFIETSFELDMTSRLGAILAIMFGWPGTAAAQAATGRIEGLVLRPDALPAAEVRVTVLRPDLQLRREAQTDVRGLFRLSALPVGTYQVHLTLVGYRPVRVDSVTVRLDRTTALEVITLTSQALELGEIVVHAAPPLIDVSSAATAINLSAEQFRNLPTERNFRSIVKLVPQANASYYPGDEADVAGDTGPGNAYFLDGVNITDPKLGSTSSNLPYNFIREIQVKTGGYEAEFGRATGAVVDVITHSGSNHFGGQAFGFFSGSGLAAEPRFEVPGIKELAFSDYDVGGSLGGPILRDRLWFFAAYNPSFHRQGVDIHGPPVPDDYRVQHLFATKLTWLPSPRTDVVLTVHGDPSWHRDLGVALGADSVVNVDAGTVVIHEGGYVLSALIRQRLGGWAQAEVGASRFNRENNREAATLQGRTTPHYLDLATNTISGGIDGSNRDHAARTTVRGSFLAVLGRHIAKVGVEYEDNFLDEHNDHSVRPGSYGGTILRLNDTTWVWERGEGGGRFHNRIPTVYVQDSWKVRNRLTLNAGLRWDAQYLSHAAGAVHNFTGEWQPRAGFIYQFGAPGTQKVTGSFGRFYEQILMDFLTGYAIDFGGASEEWFSHDPRLDPTGSDSVVSCCGPPASVRSDLAGQYFDEFTLGYERAIGGVLRAGVRGVYRTYRSVIEDVLDPTTQSVVIGNPGRGDLASAPRPRHTYTALVLTFEKPEGRLNFLASYVLSRTYGNYEGLYSFTQQTVLPNDGLAFDLPSSYSRSTGLLPNDHPHVFKLSGSYGFDFGLTLGSAVAWRSGEPNSEYGFVPPDSLFFVRRRGTAGRTPAVFDADLRIAYAPLGWRARAIRPTFYVDLFQLGNRRTTIHTDQLHYQAVDDHGTPTDPSPRYGRGTLFTPPMSARLGVSVDFGALD